MKERPIIFSGPMVRAILEGRKTQTRRIVKGCIAAFLEDGWSADQRMYETKEGDIVPAKNLCPYGQPGDRLWVRETWAEFSGIEPKVTYVYRADGLYDTPAKEHLCDNRWRPSIHMPRAASRILLEITDVRVERLREITEDDAMSEGVLRKSPVYWQSYLGDNRNTLSSRDSFWTLWSSIHGPESWSENPWVWVITFKRIEP